MSLPPKLIGPSIYSITGLITSTSMSFLGLALNYGFHPDFAVRWLKAAATRYVAVVPMLMIIVPRIQRFVVRQARLPAIRFTHLENRIRINNLDDHRC